jgi:hypothetical protein
MQPLRARKTIGQRIPVLANFLDDLIHPLRDPKAEDADPGHPFTPPPLEPSKKEKEDDDNDGPRFPMDPALA